MSTAKVWSRFTAQRPDGTIVKLRTQELTKDQHEEFFEFQRKYFVPHETFQKAAGIIISESAKEEYQRMFSHVLHAPNTHCLVCCSDDGPDPQPILGFSAMALETPDSDKINKDILERLQIETPEVQKLMFAVLKCEELYNAKEKLGFSKYFSGRGIAVDPAYRGLGIATEFVRGRRDISKEYGADATGAWMTSIGTQKAADYNKWETIYQIPFKDFGKMVDMDLSSAAPILKLQIARM